MFIKIRSWHIVGSPTRVPGQYTTLCGRRAAGDTRDALPDEKSCESCLRIKVSREEGPEA